MHMDLPFQLTVCTFLKYRMWNSFTLQFKGKEDVCETRWWELPKPERCKRQASLFSGPGAVSFDEARAAWGTSPPGHSALVCQARSSSVKCHLRLFTLLPTHSCCACNTPGTCRLIFYWRQTYMHIARAQTCPHWHITPSTFSQANDQTRERHKVSCIEW